MDMDKMRARFGANFVYEPPPAEFDGITLDRITELDVREDLRNGREPFSRIMAAQQSVPAGGVLLLRATFQPVPLYAALGKLGFAHWTERHAEDDWEVWFYRGTLTQPTTNAALAPKANAGAREAVTIDVRGLQPPEPMQLTLEALERLPADGTLVQINSRIPQLLLPLLEERGFEYVVLSEVPGEVTGLIRRTN